MNLRVNFKQEGAWSVRLELFSKSIWRPICKLDLCVFEDNDLAREIIETDSFEPIVYLRCSDLSDGEASNVQMLLSSGQNVYCRLQSASAVVTEGFHFKVLRIREIYRCSLRVEPNDDGPATKRSFKYRWMMTGISADLEFSEGYVLEKRLEILQHRMTTSLQQGHKELAREILQEKKKYKKPRRDR